MNWKTFKLILCIIQSIEIEIIFKWILNEIIPIITDLLIFEKLKKKLKKAYKANHIYAIPIMFNAISTIFNGKYYI